MSPKRKQKQMTCKQCGGCTSPYCFTYDGCVIEDFHISNVPLRVATGITNEIMNQVKKDIQELISPFINAIEIVKYPFIQVAKTVRDVTTELNTYSENISNTVSTYIVEIVNGTKEFKESLYFTVQEIKNKVTQCIQTVNNSISGNRQEAEELYYNAKEEFDDIDMKLSVDIVYDIKNVMISYINYVTHLPVTQSILGKIKQYSLISVVPFSLIPIVQNGGRKIKMKGGARMTQSEIYVAYILCNMGIPLKTIHREDINKFWRGYSWVRGYNNKDICGMLPRSTTQGISTEGSAAELQVGEFIGTSFRVPSKQVKYHSSYVNINFPDDPTIQTLLDPDNRTNAVPILQKICDLIRNDVLHEFMVLHELQFSGDVPTRISLYLEKVVNKQTTTPEDMMIDISGCLNILDTSETIEQWENTWNATCQKIRYLTQNKWWQVSNECTNVADAIVKLQKVCLIIDRPAVIIRP